MNSLFSAFIYVFLYVPKPRSEGQRDLLFHPSVGNNSK